jgi:hypothetical protein
MIQIRVEQSDHADLAVIGAAAARRGDDIVVVVSPQAPPEAVGEAVREVVTAEELGLAVSCRSVAC